MSPARLSLSAFVLALVLPVAAEEAGHSAAAAHDHDHGHTHEHGHAVLDVDLADALVRVTLTLPGGDFFGEIADDRKTRETAAALVTGPGMLLTLPDDAGCSVATSNVEVHEVSEGDHKGHSDIEIAFGLTCTNRDAIRSLAPAVFGSFPKLERLDLQVTGPGYAIEAEVTPATGPLWVRPFEAPAG
jgi:hypothetical protein